MNTRNIVIGLIVLLVLVSILMAMDGGEMLNPTPTPTPIASPIDYENLVTASGTLVPVNRASLAMRAMGQVKQIPVKVGDQVQAGAVLLRLDDAEAQATLKMAQAALAQVQSGATKEEIAIAQANLETAQAQLAKVRAGATPEEIAIAKASLDRAAAILKNAQAEYDKVKHDPYIGMLPQSAALESAYEQYRIAEAQYQHVLKGATPEDIRIAASAVAAAQANLQRLQAGARPEEIAAAQARVEQAQATLNAMTLTAPFAGTIAAINTREGETVTPGVPVIMLGDVREMRLETDDLSETDVARVKIGHVANITFEAMPTKTFKGKVTHIAPISSQKQGSTNYTIYVELEQLDPALRWGMTGHIEINVKQ